MAKLIGLILVLSSLISLVAGTVIDIRYSSPAPITGSVISNIVSQPEINLSFVEYVEAAMFSYSITSLIMGLMFIFRV